MLLSFNYSSFNSLKSIFSNTLIFDMRLQPKSKFFNLVKFISCNKFISDISLKLKFNIFISLNTILFKYFKPLSLIFLPCSLYRQESFHGQYIHYYVRILL